VPSSLDFALHELSAGIAANARDSGNGILEF
jgi:hypothetical protein